VYVRVFFRFVFFFSSRRRHTRFSRDWSSDVCSSDLARQGLRPQLIHQVLQAGKQALILIPEINLGPQTLARFEKRFNARIALLRSEERRVGKECRARGSAWGEKKNAGGIWTEGGGYV